MKKKMKIKQSPDLLKTIQNLRKIVFHAISYDYHSTDCSGECDTINDFCRCSEIVSPTVKHIDVNCILDQVKNKQYSQIENYCIDRLLRYDISNKDIYKPIISRGYYGEELDGATIDGTHFDSIIEKFKLYQTCSNNISKINFVLYQEYGYILDSIKEYNNVTIKNVNINDIKLNENHYIKLNKDIVNSYSGTHTLPRCIVMPFGGQYKLIDGYHRYSAAVKDNLKSIPVIELS